MTGHIHAESMKLYAEDAATHEKPWELWQVDHGDGFNICKLHPQWSTNNKYRRKPRTININGFEVPKPMREKPNMGSNYYTITLNQENVIRKEIWYDFTFDNIMLKNGLCHSTKEAAEIHAKALLSFTRKGESDE